MVTSFAEVWIEMYQVRAILNAGIVTSFAEVWIEMTIQRKYSYIVLSLPSRKCGLKCPLFVPLKFIRCHFLRGSVD